MPIQTKEEAKTAAAARTSLHKVRFLREKNKKYWQTLLVKHETYILNSSLKNDAIRRGKTGGSLCQGRKFSKELEKLAIGGPLSTFVPPKVSTCKHFSVRNGSIKRTAMTFRWNLQQMYKGANRMKRIKNKLYRKRTEPTPLTIGLTKPNHGKTTVRRRFIGHA